MNYKKIYIVKLGSAVLIDGDTLNTGVMQDIIAWVISFIQSWIAVIIVSSGAVAIGRQILVKHWIARQKKDVGYEQICASIGQPLLMKYYNDAFEKYGMTVSQGLLTRRDFAERESYISMKQLLLSSLSLSIVPIINENDVLSPEELDFSDNDQLSALVAGMVGAEKLIILSDVAWLYDRHPDDGWKIVKEVSTIDARILAMVDTRKSSVWKWWMMSKLKTAKLIMDLGIDMILASWKVRNILPMIARDENPWTLFHAPSPKSIDTMRKWLKAWAVPKWKIIVSTIISDLLQQKKRTSLLVIGVEQIIKDFWKWDIVEVCDERGKCLGIGISKMKSDEVLRAKERGESKIVIHTDYYNSLDDTEKSF